MNRNARSRTATPLSATALTATALTATPLTVTPGTHPLRPGPFRPSSPGPSSPGPDRSSEVVRPLPGAHRWRASADTEETVRRYLQGALALTYTVGSDLPADPDRPALSVVPPSADEQTGIPDPQAWASRFMQAVMEVLASDRPLSQLVRWTSSDVFREIALRQAAMARPRATSARLRHQVSSVRVSQPHSAAAEVAARVTVGRRSRVIAARLDFERDRWLCTAVCFG